VFNTYSTLSVCFKRKFRSGIMLEEALTKWKYQIQGVERT